MSHIIQVHETTAFVQTKNAKTKDKTEFWREVEFNRYGIVAMALLVQSCIGSIGVYYAVQLEGILSMSILSTVVMANMAANAMCLAVAPMKVIFWFGGLSVVISAIAILIGLIML